MFRYYLTYSFAMFAMFFGSGNLVFPLQIGASSGNLWIFGFAGLLITGVLLPFCGLFVIKLYNGNYNNFFNQVGWLPGNIITLFTLSLLGAFGVVPRCITVAYAGISGLFPSLSLFYFSLIFCILSFIISLRNKIMISLIGKFMTPILLIFLAILVILGIQQEENQMTIYNNYQESFWHGFFVGYQTMDLFAAFFFSALIFSQIQKDFPNLPDKQLIKIALLPSLIGSVILATVYMGFIYLGAKYSHLFDFNSPEMALPRIAKFLLGDLSVIFVSILMLLSCLTTAVALNNIYAEYLNKLLRLKSKYFPVILLLTIFTSFILSLLDFQGIVQILAPALEISYPALIILTCFSIILYRFKTLRVVSFYLMLFFSIYKKLVL